MEPKVKCLRERNCGKCKRGTSESGKLIEETLPKIGWR